jgi:hypothetical protein
MEIFWLIVAMLTAIFGIQKINNEGIDNNWILVILPFAAAGLSALRYFTRKRLEAHEQNQK